MNRINVKKTRYLPFALTGTLIFWDYDYNDNSRSKKANNIIFQQPITRIGLLQSIITNDVPV